MDIDATLRRQQALESQRATFDSHWQEVQDLVLPQTVGFTTSDTPGAKKMDKVFDSTPITANEYFAAAFQGMLTPATEQWHKLVPADPGLAEDYAVNAWCDAATEVLFRARYDPRAQFGQAIGEAFLALGAFGNAVVFVDEKRGDHLVYKCGHPREYFFVENEWGVVDTMHRKLTMTAENMVRKFGESACPEGVQRDARQSPDKEYEVLHVVTPGYGKRQAFGFESCYIAIAGKKELRRRGYRTFPYAVGRYTTTAGEVYGRGKGMIALPDVKTLNEMMKTILRAGQKVVDPPVLLNDDGALQAFQGRPGALNRGAVTADGKALAQPFISGARLDIGLDMVQDVRRRIEAVFHVDLFRILVDKPQQITATEALIRAQEKGALLAPPALRLQGEFLGALVRRELDILTIAGNFPPMPDVLAYRGGVKVEYAAPINQAQKAQKGVAVNTFLSNVGALVEIDPGALDIVDTDEVVRVMRDVSGAPQKIVRSDEAVAARRQQKQQERDAAMALAAAEQSGKAAKDWTQAQATAATVPNSTVPLLQ